MVKKLFVAVVVVLLSVVSCNKIINNVYIEELGGGYYVYLSSHQILKSRTTKNIGLINILKTKHDDQYIIAIRLPMRVFYGDNNCTTFSAQHISYLLIDKQTNRIYETDDYMKFIQKLKEKNVQIMFDKDELKQAKKAWKYNQHLYDNRQTLNYLKTHCKEAFMYPIERF